MVPVDLLVVSYQAEVVVEADHQVDPFPVVGAEEVVHPFQGDPGEVGVHRVDHLEEGVVAVDPQGDPFQAGEEVEGDHQFQGDLEVVGDPVVPVYPPRHQPF